jgi:single-strand DNA-binding protein
MLNNRLELIGRLTKTPELTVAESGKKICNFRLAVNTKKDENADFFSLTAFDKTAEIIANHCAKGELIAVAGRLANNNYTDKNGNNVYRDRIIINEVMFLSSKKSDNAQQSDSKADADSVSPADLDTDDFDIENGIEF